MNVPNQDLEHLKLLSILHYVLGGMMILGGCLPFIHLTLGVIMLTNPDMLNGKGGGPPPELAQIMGIMFTVIPIVIIACIWTTAGCLIMAGRNLAQRRKYKFCFVVACISCVFMPLGTALGVFTLIMLQKPTVKALFLQSDNPFAV